MIDAPRGLDHTVRASYSRRMRSLFPLLLGLASALAQAAEPAPRWWKGNLHTHSLWSDGNDFPDMIADWYQAHGYHFLALSDHNTLSDHERWIPVKKNSSTAKALAKYIERFGEPWVEQRDGKDGLEVRLKMLSEFRTKVEEPGRFLMIPSEEITGRSVHINATNIREIILPYRGPAPVTSESIVAAMQKTVNAVMEQRARTGVPMFAHINHPNFKWAITAEELMQVENERFFEVYNGHSSVRNAGDAEHASTERIWDILLTERLAVLGKEPFFGLATDDSHHYLGERKNTCHPGRGWVVVRAKTLAAEALIAGLEAGEFYASSGVTLKELRREPNRISLEIEPEPGVTYTTEFIGTRTGFNRASEPVTGDHDEPLRVTRKYSDDLGVVLFSKTGTTASYALKADEIYVRARVTSSKLKADPSSKGEFERAWVQPIWHR